MTTKRYSSGLSEFLYMVRSCPLSRCSMYVGDHGFNQQFCDNLTDLAESVNVPPYDLIAVREVDNPRNWLSDMKPGGVIMCFDLKHKSAQGFRIEKVGDYWRCWRKS